MSRYHFTYVLLTIALLLMFGCQSGDSPMTPDQNPGDKFNPEEITSGSMKYGMQEGHQLLALMEVQYDAETRTVSAVPLRTAYQHLNLVQIIPIYCKPVSACLDFIITSINEATYTVELNVVVKHPVNDSYTDVFDLRGIGIFKGLLDAGFSGGTIATQILNADGYTTAYDAGGEFDAFLNPYIAFNKDKPKRIFAHSTQTIEHFIAQFPSFEPQDSKFLYALDATWSDPLYYNPDDILTDPNMPEPYEVNILYTDPVANQYLSEGTIVIQAKDWQKNASGARVQVPDLFGGWLDLTEVMDADGNYLYYGNFINDFNPSVGVYPVLAKAMDEFETQPDLINPGLLMELSNYQLGLEPPSAVQIYDSGLNQRPTASAIASDLFIEAGQMVTFDCTGSSDPEDTIVSTVKWDLDGDWKFDDGTSQIVEHQYNTPGKYAASLIVTDLNGLSDILNEPIIITVSSSENTPPVASAFATNYTPQIGQTITLNASASTDAEDGKPIEWLWDLDNDGVYGDKSGEVINHSWNIVGVYYVDVRVKDSKGATDTLDQKLQISVMSGPNEPPVAAAQADITEPVVGQSVNFDGGASSDSDGFIQLYEWDFDGDSQFDDGFGQLASFKYWVAGEYLVNLRVTDNGGLTDTLDAPITITVTGVNQPPTAVAKSNKVLVHTDETVIFNGTDSTDPEENKPNTYAWDLDGDGQFDDSFLSITNWQYSTPGIYNVDLQVCDTPGLCDTLNTKLVIQVYSGSNTPPVAVAEADKVYAFEGDTITFDGSKSFDLEDGSPVSWQWDLDNDGQYDDSPFIIAQKQFPTEGTYYVDLKVLDSEGLFDTLDTKLEITIVPVGTNLPPVASAEVNCTVPFVGQTIMLSDSSVDYDGSITKWEWNFDDGNGWINFTSTQGNGKHSFTSTGVFFINLRVTDNNNVTATLTNPISIIVGESSFNPPTTQPDCGLTSTHFYAGSMSTSIPNTSYNSRDIAFYKNGTFFMVVSDALYQLMPPAQIMGDPILTNVGWVNSIDCNSNIVAVADKATGRLEIYSVATELPATFQEVKSLNIGKPIDAVTVDKNGNVYYVSEMLLYRLDYPDYQIQSCATYDVSGLSAYGDIKEMDFNPWNRSMYFALLNGTSAGVVEVDYYGSIGAINLNALNGPTNYVDIVVDQYSSPGENAACRIVVGGGINKGYLSRFNADLIPIGNLAFGYYGISSIALSQMSNELVALEDCCISWIDFLVPPMDWFDVGE